MLNNRVSASTRGLTETEKAYSLSDQLQWVALFPDLRKLARAKLMENPYFKQVSSRVLDLDNMDDRRLYESMHPAYCADMIPPEIRQESDTTLCMYGALIWPAMRFLKLMIALDDSRKNKRMYAGACQGKKGAGTPDGGLFPDVGVEFSDINEEWKTRNSLSSTAFGPLMAALRRARILNVPRKVCWFEKDENETMGTYAKILYQIYAQLKNEHRDVRFSILSSFAETYFFYRPPGPDNVLFISEVCPYGSVCALDFIAFFALALAYTQINPGDVPKFDSRKFEFLKTYYDQHPAKQGKAGLDARDVDSILELMVSDSPVQRPATPSHGRNLRSRSNSVAPGVSASDIEDNDATPRARKVNADATPTRLDFKARRNPRGDQ
ncbi:hypothetical protein EIP91_003013 [Steccherinum ochraceum]|uniref:Uncharacterized protein n=1 Tax=Steccherinum ochraceum TaxID=92696 RepID=A0A4V2MW72_9APHY|nr:hypothetical protein EIP91_003013 [Steccherinum ochraceum]